MGLASKPVVIYAFNTAGAVIGSILGGFVLIPQLSINHHLALDDWQPPAVASLSPLQLIASMHQRAKLGGLTAIVMACRCHLSTRPPRVLG